MKISLWMVCSLVVANLISLQSLAQATPGAAQHRIAHHEVPVGPVPAQGASPFYSFQPGAVFPTTPQPSVFCPNLEDKAFTLALKADNKTLQYDPVAVDDLVIACQAYYGAGDSATKQAAALQQFSKAWAENTANVRKLNAACMANLGTDQKSSNFNYRWWLPAWGSGCTEVAIKNFFAVEKGATYVSTGRFLYNPNQTTSQVQSDLLTATFPMGFQAIVAGTASLGTPQTAVTSTSATTTTTSNQTDPVQAAVAKLESGGDFNLRFNIPLLSKITNNFSLTGAAAPSVAFNLSSINSTTTGSGSSAAQTGVTQATESYFNIPFDIQWQTQSYDNLASIYVDIKPAYEIVSPAFASSIGLKSDTFNLGQYSAGIEFGQDFQLGVQYFVGPSQVYTLASTTGTATPTTTHIGGLHLVVTYSPKKQ